MTAQDIASTGDLARPGDGECPSAWSRHRPSACQVPQGGSSAPAHLGLSTALPVFALRLP